MALVFVDLEASSLLPGSFPIEVGWVHEDGTGESHLVRPADEWLGRHGETAVWSVEAERLHGITLQELMDTGEPVSAVAAMADAVLSPLQVLACSDAPEPDGHWLGRLYEAGGVRRDVCLASVRSVYRASCHALQLLLPSVGHPDRWRVEHRVEALTKEIIARAEEDVHVDRQLHRRVTHRALPDAQALWRTHVSIKDQVRRHLREAGH